MQPLQDLQDVTVSALLFDYVFRRLSTHYAKPWFGALRKARPMSAFCKRFEAQEAALQAGLYPQSHDRDD